MNKVLLFGVVLILLACCGIAYGAGELEWVTRTHNQFEDQYAADVAPLGDGGVIVTGWFGGEATFGLVEPQQTVLTSAGLTDMYIARFESDGELVWARRVGAQNSDQGGAVSTFSDGSFVVGGFFQNSVTFGEAESNQTTLVADGLFGGSDIFIAKYTANGFLIWAKRAGGDSDGETVNRIVALPDGGCVALGRIAGTSFFGPGEINETVITNPFAPGLFLARYRSDGSLDWVRSIPAATQLIDPKCGLGVTNDGSVLVGGTYFDDLVLGTDGLIQIELLCDGPSDIFLAKYNSSGNLLWAKRAGSFSEDVLWDMDVVEDDGFVFTGYFSDQIIFGPSDPGPIVLNGHAFNAYIARYNADGLPVWAKRNAGDSVEMPMGITAFPNGSSVIIGTFSGTSIFGPEDPNPVLMQTNFPDYPSEYFVASYNADGSLAWVRRIQAHADGDTRLDVTALPDNTVVAVGGFVDDATFNLLESDFVVLSNDTDNSLFVAKYRADLATEALLTVQSTPVQSFSIQGSPGSAGGTTNYTRTVFEGSSIRLTAPPSQVVGTADYAFSNWTINGVAQAAGDRILEFIVDGDITAVAQYNIVPHVINVQSLPTGGVEVTGFAVGVTPFSFQVTTGGPLSLTAPDEFNSLSFFRWQDERGNLLSDSTTLNLDASVDATVVAVYASLEITAPAAGAALERGQKTKIQWETDLPKTDLKIELLNGSGGLWEIKPKISSSKEAFNWKVGKVKGNMPAIPDGDGFRLRISTLNGAIEDVSEVFAIGVPISLQIQGPSSVPENSTAQYTAIAEFNFGNPTDVTDLAKWKSKSKFGKVKKGGVLTTKEVVGNQSVQITATYGKKPNSQSDTFDVVVTEF